MNTALKKRLTSSGILDSLKTSGEKYAKSPDSKSLITVYEQQLYAWHDEGVAVLTVNLSTSESGQDDFKKLLPSNPPIFEVESLSMNCLGNLLSLVGRKGIMVMEVPWEVGNLRTNAAGTNCWFCRSWTVADRIFTHTSRVALLQASWYPACRTSTYIMILSSDNYLRLYDVMDLPAPLQVISLGSNAKSSYISNEFAISLPSALGENAVSFDFGPVEGKSSSMSKDKSENGKTDIICPIYILHGNGDVYLVNMYMRKDGSRSVKVGTKQLSIYPAAEDNYGVDACTLLCLHTNPSILVIAMASGILYHCVILDENLESNEELQPFWMLSDTGNNPALFVHGSVQLPMFATQEDDDIYSQSIRLYRDITTNSKYHCSMVCGVHTVVVSFVSKVEDSIRKGDLEDNIAESLENDCIVEHLLCTQPVTSVSPIPVIGLTSVIQNSGIVLICLLSSWEFECLALLPSFQSYAPPLLSSEMSSSVENTVNNNQQESFENIIRDLLQRSTGAPILKSNDNADNSEHSIIQCLDLVGSATQHLRQEYIQKFHAVQVQIDSRTKVLQQRKNQQMVEVQQLIQNKQKLSESVKNLMKRYSDISVTQLQLFERLEAVLKKLERRFPFLSAAERNMKTELQHMERKMNDLENALEQLKKREKLRDEKAREFVSVKSTETLTRQLGNMSMGDAQLKNVLEILHLEGNSIGKLAKNISNLKKEMMLT